MKYIGMQSSIWANRTKTFFLVILFPMFLFAMVLLAFSIDALSKGSDLTMIKEIFPYILSEAWTVMLIVTPIILIWFIIAFSLHRKLIFKFSGAKAITRKEYPELYNIVENLCISKWLPVPNIGILEDDSYNAFATWWKIEKSWIVFSRGIIEKLDKAEIEAVAWHELTHIINKDTLLMVCIVVFIGILWTLGEILIRSAGINRRSDNGDSGKAAMVIMLIWLGLMVLWYLVFPFIRLAISRKREFMADAWSVELTKDKYAMISALKKISGDARIESIKKQTVASMCIETPFKKDAKTKKVKWFHNLLSSHPPIGTRIDVLNGY